MRVELLSCYMDRVRHRASGFELAVKLVDIQNLDEQRSVWVWVWVWVWVCSQDGIFTFLNQLLSVADIKFEVEILKRCRNSNIVNFYGCYGPDSKVRTCPLNLIKLVHDYNFPLPLPPSRAASGS